MAYRWRMGETHTKQGLQRLSDLLLPGLGGQFSLRAKSRDLGSTVGRPTRSWRVFSQSGPCIAMDPTCVLLSMNGVVVPSIRLLVTDLNYTKHCTKVTLRKKKILAH